MRRRLEPAVSNHRGLTRPCPSERPIRVSPALASTGSASRSSYDSPVQNVARAVAQYIELHV